MRGRGEDEWSLWDGHWVRSLYQRGANPGEDEGRRCLYNKVVLRKDHYLGWIFRVIVRFEKKLLIARFG
jgi:hypothetical protein